MVASMKYLMLMLMLLATAAVADQNAVTDDGKTVVLKVRIL